MEEKIIIDEEHEVLKRKYKESLIIQKKLQQWHDEDLREIAELKQKYEKMVEISEENLIKYEDLRIDNQKLIMEIENLKSQIDFEAQKQAILLQENEELKQKYEKLYEHQGEIVKAYSLNKNKLSLYKHALEEIKAELKDDLTCESRECGCDDYSECLECLKETILNIITEAIELLEE